MAKNKISDYDGVTAGNNTDIGGISIDEGMLPSAVNNSLRELTKQLGAFADGTDSIDALSVTGSISAADAALSGTGAIKVPVGTTAQRPTATQGQIRYNTTDGSFEGYDGSAWGAIGGSSGEVSLILYEYTATSGQTIFSGADDNAATLAYTANNIQVVMNGVILDPSDYTATNGTSVVLASGAATGDLLNIYAFQSFSVADTVSASAGGTFAANIDVTGTVTADEMQVDGATAGIYLMETDATDLNSRLRNSNGDFIIDTTNDAKSSLTNRFRLDHATGDISFYDSTGVTQGLFWDASTLRLGLGTTSPTSVADIRGSNPSIFSRGLLYLTNTETAAQDGGSQISLGGTFNGTSDTFFAGIAGRKEDGTAGSYKGYLQFSTRTTAGMYEHMRIDSSGNLLVGTSSTSTTQTGNGKVTFSNGNTYIFRASGAGRDNINFVNGGSAVGSITTSTSATAYNTSSDYRLKENVTEVTGAAGRVKALNPVRFNFIAEPDTTVDGFLAHEVQDIVPEAVTGAKDAMRDEEYEVTPAVLDDEGNVVTEAVMGTRSVPDYQGIDQSKLVPLLTAALQESLTKIDDLESRLAALETA